MAIIRGQPYVVRYIAWNTSTAPWQPVTGDASNHTVYVDIDGNSSSAVSVTITEIDATNRPGEYKFTLPGTYTDGNSIGVSVRSSTPNVFIQPMVLLTEQGRIDANVSSRAAPGDAMGLVNNAITSAKLDSSGITAIAGGILLNTSHKLYTDSNGYVTASYADSVNITATQINDIAQASATKVWDEPKSAHNTAGTYGYFLDTSVSSRMPTGNVTVGGYDPSAHPATLVWSHSQRTITQFDPEFADVIWNRLRSAVTRPTGSFGHMLDKAISAAESSIITEIDAVKGKTDQLQFDSNNGLLKVQVNEYANGKSPAELVLQNSSWKIQTDSSGYVTAATVLDKTDYTLTGTEVSNIAAAVWDRQKSYHTIAGTFGALLDVAVSSRQPAGNVTVGGYATGQDPASLVWAHTQRTLTSVLNDVGGITIADQFWNRLQDAVTRPVGSFGYFIDMKLSDIAASGASDWTPAEKEQIRYVLGIDGDQQAPTGNAGYLPTIKGKTDQLQFTGGNVHASVQTYASGLSPAQQILLNTGNKLATDSSGFVTVGSNQDKSGYSLSASGLDQVADAVWDEPKSGHSTPGTYGYFLDIAVSSRMASGNVTVGGYASGQSPADLILINPSNKLATDSSGKVTVGVNTDKTGYMLDTSQADFIADSVWDELRADHTGQGTFGDALDAKVSSRHPNSPVSVGSYQPGVSPADLILTTPSVKLVNTADGGVRVGQYSVGASPAEQVLINTAQKLYTDSSGNVRVGGYASGQSPANHILSQPNNKLATDSSGRVTVGSNQDKSDYSLSASERSNIASAVWSFVVESGQSALKLLRIIFSVLAGKRAVVGDRFKYYAQDNTTIRVEGVVDQDKNRVIELIDGD